MRRSWSLCVLAAFAPAFSQDLEPGFQQVVKPFFQQHCLQCHNTETAMLGIRVDQLDATLPDRDIRVWQAVRHRISNGTMPPKGTSQPSEAGRRQVADWISRALEAARLRPAPKNGLVRRLTVPQYRNTLRELLQLDDDLTEILPPDAVSKDGFVNNKDTLQLLPLQLEAYLEIAEEALNRAIVDPAARPRIQNFRVDLGQSINPHPLPDPLILGANSLLLDNKDFVVTQPVPAKPFPFQPVVMRTKYRFIEGYQGNDTVRGWRDYDSIYHAVFACMRGSRGYPKGLPYSTVAEGLLLRPAIPNDELFESDGTYGPKANFKISLRELPDQGRFRVTVTAAKYDDGLLLDKGAVPQQAAGSLVSRGQPATVTIPRAGVYQVDIFPAALPKPPAPDASRLEEGLVGEGLTTGEGEFTVAAWIQPKELKRAPVVSHGWRLELADNRGGLRLETAGGAVTAQGVLKANAWQHVAALVRPGKGGTRLYVNGYLVARGEVGAVKGTGSVRAGSRQFQGEVDGVRVYRRVLGEAELQALVEPRRQFAVAPPERPREITLKLGGREYSGKLEQPAFLVLRLAAGPLALRAQQNGLTDLDRIVFTPLPETNETALRFLAFEKRLPKLGVHLGLRRDCGSTFAPAGAPQVVAGGKAARYVFEGAIRNFPSPDVEKDNVNYLAGIREIAVRSEYTDGRDMPRLLVKSVEFEGPFYDQWPPRSHRGIFVSSDPRQILRGFATRAYRRAVTSAEEASLMAVFQKSTAAGRGFRDAIKDALVVALTSPQFLFLTETSSSPKPEPLDNWELASKLSYFLWNGPPDAATLRLASSGTLRAQLNAEVDRMIADARFSRFVREFAAQWLSLDKFQVLEPDRARFPKLTRDMRAELRQEPAAFLEYLIRNNLPARNLIASDFVVANEAVANYYDLADQTESGFAFRPIPVHRRDLGGVLTQASVLAGLSDGRESNPVKRGAWLARKIIAEPPNDPPPNVPALKEAKNLTLRERLEQHRNQSGCRQCHSVIDPWGVALEEFDAGGRLKQQTADAHSVLPDKTEVAGIDDFRRYLGDDRIDQVTFSVLKHLTSYATGRTLTYQESSSLQQDEQKLKASGYRMKDLIHFVVNSRMFLEK